MKKVVYLLSLFVFWKYNVDAKNYASVSFGTCSLEKTDDFCFPSSSFVFSEVGRDFENFRGALQVSYLHYGVKGNDGVRGHYLADVKKVRTYVSSFFANVYKDWQLSSSLTLYIGGGLGFSKLRIFTKTSGDDVTSDAKYLLTGQIMAGIIHKISESWAISTGYRCMKLANTSFTKNERLGLHNEFQYRTPLLHCFEVGLRYTF